MRQYSGKKQHVVMKIFCMTLIFCVFFIQSRVWAQELINLSFEEAAGEIQVKATYPADSLQILSKGILMVDGTEEVDFDTPGRIRINFRELDSSNSCIYTMPDNEVMKNVAFRAFMEYTDENGKRQTGFSQCYTFYSYQNSSKEFIENNVRYGYVDGGLTVLGVVNGVKELSIPEEIRGYMVISIAEKAFENDTNIESIDLPDTIQIIGKRAFAGCISLREMY